jgi:uncharacterized protein HemX
MSRNREKNSQSLHWMTVIKWVLIAAVVSGLGLVYMLKKNQNLHLAAETHRLEVQLAQIQARNRELSIDLEGMKSPARLQARLAKMHSTLVGWNDPSLDWHSLEQNTHARVAKIGTMPKANGVDFEDSAVTATH